MTARKTCFLSELEFNILAGAAGIESIPSFVGGMTEAPGEAAQQGAVWLMVRRGLLAPDAAGGYTLCKELSDIFRILKDSRVFLDVRRGQRIFNHPSCLAFTDGRRLVSMRPGARPEDYVGLDLYSGEELAEWAEDAHLVLGDNMPDDLLEAAEERLAGGRTAEENIPPADAPEGLNLADLEQGSELPDEDEDDGESAFRLADAEMSKPLQDFLLENTWPGAEAPDLPEDSIPEEVTGCVDCRDMASRNLLRRMFLVRQPLFDHLFLGSPEGTSTRLYRVNALVEEVETMLKEGGGAP